MSADRSKQGQERKAKRCGAKTRKGVPCALSAGYGTDHKGYGCCKFHGGSTPNHQKAAQRKQAEEAVLTFGLPVTIDPHAALLAEVHRTAGAVAWLGGIVADLDRKAITHGVVKTVVQRDADGKQGAPTVETRAAVNVWVRLWQDERDRLVRVCRAAIDAGVAEREVELAEAQAVQLAQVTRAILSDLGIDPTADKTRETVRRHFTLLQGGKAA